MHWKTHSYKDVHIGKSHTDNFECGLCEKEFGNLEMLTVHLQTCEIYRCRRCYKKETSISEIKADAVKSIMEMVQQPLWWIRSQ